MCADIQRPFNRCRKLVIIKNKNLIFLFYTNFPRERYQSAWSPEKRAVLRFLAIEQFDIMLSSPSEEISAQILESRIQEAQIQGLHFWREVGGQAAE